MTPERNAIEEMPRYIHYPEVAHYREAYAESATEKRIVVIDKATFNNGYQWGLQGEEVLLSPEDAKALDRAGHTVRPDEDEQA